MKNKMQSLMLLNFLLLGGVMRNYIENHSHENNTSIFNPNDYRSRLYKGSWKKFWLKKIAEESVQKAKTIYEMMWENAIDKNEHMPKKLFKFYPFSTNSLSCIEENQIFLNEPHNFNDPYDCYLTSNKDFFDKKIFIEYCKKENIVEREIISNDELNDLMESSTKKGRICDSQYSRLIKKLMEEKPDFNKMYNEFNYKNKDYYAECLENLYKKSQIRVSSFAHLEEGELMMYMEMWAHYAANHQGFCVEYDLTTSINDNLKSILYGGLLPCNYASKPYNISGALLFKNEEKRGKDKELSFKEKAQLNKSIFLSFLQKSTSWSYEKEWRLILPNDLIEVNDYKIHFFPIKAIYCGCKMEKHNREYLYKWAVRKKIDIYQMEMKENSFCLYNRKIENFDELIRLRGLKLHNSKYWRMQKDPFDNFL